MNSLFGFKIKGSYFRHPGEIVKVSTLARQTEEESAISNIGGFEANNNGFFLIYTTAVTHILNGAKFEDLIYASKICSISPDNKPTVVTETATGDEKAAAGTKEGDSQTKNTGEQQSSENKTGVVTNTTPATKS